MNTHINMQLTMHNKYTNDDVHTDACAELAHSAHCSTPGDVISHLIGSSPEQTLCHPRSYPWAHLFDSLLSFYFHLSFLSFSVYFLHSEQFPELGNPIVMASLRYSAAEESEDTLNSFTAHTGYEPNLLTFGERNDSSVPDQDVDDVTLGKMLTEAHRGQVDYFVQGGMSVSQSSSSVMFDGSGQPDGEWSIAARKHRLGLYLKSKDKPFLRSVTRESVITNSKQLKQWKSADSYKDNYGDSNWNFVKLVNKVLQKWRNYGNFKVLPSIRWQDESSSRIRTLFFFGPFWQSAGIAK